MPGLDAELSAWRHRTMNILLWVIVAARSFQLILYLQNIHRTGQAIGPADRLTMAPYFVLLGIAICRGLPHQLRGWLLITLGYLHLTLIFIYTGRVDGLAPLTLVSQPIYAMILLGRNSAWIAAGISVALYTTFSVLLHLGLCPPAAPILSTRGPLQSLAVWTVVFVPTFALQDRFIALFKRLLAREHQIRAHLEESIHERQILEHALLETSDRERQAVGHELHDGVCQQITGAILHCKALEKAMDLGQAPTPGSLQSVASMLDASLGQVHDLARGLSPGSLTIQALLPSLQDLVRRTRETFEVDCEVEAGELPAHLEPSTVTHLYRIAQEALANAVKHGQPERILIRLGRAGDTLHLEIQNDGRVDTPPSQEGMGLRIMRHRSNLIGATFTFHAEDRDIRARCVLPLGRSA